MIIADTGFWVALASPRDRHHQRAVAWMDAIDEPLITTWPVVTETCHLLLNRLGTESQSRFLASYSAGGFEIFELQRHMGLRITELMRKYADLPMDLADASLVLLAERLGHGRILSTDERDFHAYRWKQREPFQNFMANLPNQNW